MAINLALFDLGSQLYGNGQSRYIIGNATIDNNTIDAGKNGIYMAAEN
ncbi:MAG TPA: hypothetical protein VMW67_03085 [Desulfobacteria bacterium]|nr:hypothetical protein [Desulfobacteria bacterium]